MSTRPPDTAGARWRLPRGEALRWRHWDDDVVLRVASTGAVHLLHPTAAAVFLTLAEADRHAAAAGVSPALDLSALAAALLDTADTPALSQLAALLRDLQALGAVEEVPSP